MVTRRLPKTYSGNQFICGIALVMVGIVSVGLMKGPANTGDLAAKAGTSPEPYMLDPYAYETTAPGVWEINKRNVEMVRKARALARGGRTEEIKLLLKQGLKIDKDLGGCRTMLMVASESGQLQLVRFLLSRHARVDAVDRDGNTPLSLATDHGHTAVVAALLQANPGLQSTASSGFAESAEKNRSPVQVVRSRMLRIAE